MTFSSRRFFFPLVLAAAVLVIGGVLRLPVSVVTSEPFGAGGAAISAQQRPLQALYQVEERALKEGWSSALAETAGSIWWELGDPVEAVAYWQMADDSEAIHRRLAEAYLELGEWGLASDLLRSLETGADDATRAWVAMQLGLMHAASDPQSARDWLEQAASSEPGYASSLGALINTLSVTSNPVRIGMALARLELWQYAEHAFMEAPYDPVALAFLALSREQLGKDGSVYLSAALRLGDNDSQVRYLEGLIFRLRGDYEASLAAFIQATALHPDDPALVAELGTAYQHVGDLVSAERWLQFALDLSSGDPAYARRIESLRTEEATLRDAIAAMIDSAPIPESETMP
ncbi:MAG: hypothetical protein JNL42_09915 [Anaerolineae bacterium]|nr:hypothetical protein [Anaerolineae bacterium]